MNDKNITRKQKSQTNLFSMVHVMDELKSEIIRTSLDHSKFLDPNMHEFTTLTFNKTHTVDKMETDKQGNQHKPEKISSSSWSDTYGSSKNMFIYDEILYCVPEDFFYKCIGNLECLRRRDLRATNVNNCSDDNTCLFWNDQIKNSRNKIVSPSEATKTGVYKKNSDSRRPKEKTCIREFNYFCEGISRSPLYWTLRFAREYSYSSKKHKPKCICRNGSRNRDGVTCINPWHYILDKQD